jgi:hypothetical protein
MWDKLCGTTSQCGPYPKCGGDDRFSINITADCTGEAAAMRRAAPRARGLLREELTGDCSSNDEGRGAKPPLANSRQKPEKSGAISSEFAPKYLPRREFVLID